MSWWGCFSPEAEVLLLIFWSCTVTCLTVGSVMIWIYIPRPLYIPSSVLKRLLQVSLVSSEQLSSSSAGLARWPSSLTSSLPCILTSGILFQKTLLIFFKPYFESFYLKDTCNSLSQFLNLNVFKAIWPHLGAVVAPLTSLDSFLGLLKFSWNALWMPNLLSASFRLCDYLGSGFHARLRLAVPYHFKDVPENRIKQESLCMKVSAIDGLTHVLNEVICWVNVLQIGIRSFSQYPSKTVFPGWAFPEGTKFLPVVPHAPLLALGTLSSEHIRTHSCVCDLGLLPSV